MNIDELDFSKKVWHCGEHTGGALLCQSECKYLNTTWRSFMDSFDPENNPTHLKYACQLATYYERFGQHMPSGLRKALLLDIKEKTG